LRRYGVEGAPRGPAALLTAGLPHEQALRAACGTRRIADLGDRLAIAWSGDADAGDRSSANATLVSARPFDLAGRRQGIDPAAARPASEIADGAVAAPHVPPVFDPRGADHGVREIRIDDAGIGFDAILDTGWTPPDVQMAVGPGHIVAITNGRISFFDKSGAQSFTMPIEGAGGFWGSVGASNFVFDPEVIYDPLSDRFWAVASEGNAPPGGSHSYALVAVSDDSDPNGTWFKYRFDTTSVAGSIFDSPNIGVDANAVYVTGDGSLGNYQILIWDKASLLAGSPPAISKSLNYITTNQSAGLPPVTFPDSPRVVLIEHKEAASNSSVTLVAINDPLGTPNLSTALVTVPAYTKPEDPPQKGTSVRPETFDARFWSSANRNGSIWATHHVGVSRVLARWYQVALNGWPDSGNLPMLAQSGTIDPGGTWRTFFSAIGVDGENNAVMTFAASSPTEYIQMAVATRKATDPPGSFGPMEIVKSNSGPYTEANRWGDYAAVRPDEGSAGTFWANHEYAVSSNNWRTWVQQVILPPSSDLDGDGLVNGADLGILLGAWGTPGPGDLNGDGVVDGADLGNLLADWTG
ncbi:MAG: hypothetical protein KDA22_09355, partial [Phycisphaerales bacterium]|nr:hypothetical protein [Phycisphaerales bacterium]